MQQGELEREQSRDKRREMATKLVAILEVTSGVGQQLIKTFPRLPPPGESLQSTMTCDYFELSMF